MFDSSQLGAYLERIGLASPRRPTLHALRRIHRAHIDAIPYENLDIQLGRPVSLADDDVFAKLVERGRGGFCYEKNHLLGLALEALGFDVRRVLGGVARQTEGDGQWYNHMPLVVRIGGSEYLADTGIGTGPRDPLPIRTGSHRVGAWDFGVWELGEDLWRCSIDSRITDLTFDFRLGRMEIGDFKERCLELSTSPDSQFVRTLTVQKPGDQRMRVLRARTLNVYDPQLPDGKSVEVVADAAAFGELLRDEFGLTLADSEVDELWTKAAAQHERKLAEDKAPSAS